MLALCILSCFLFCASIPRESNSNTDNFPHSHGCVSMLLLRHQSHLCYRPCQYNALNSQYLDLQSSGSSRSLLAILNISVWSCGLMHRKCVALSSVSVCRELLTCLTKKEKKKNIRRVSTWLERCGEGVEAPGSWLCLPVEWGHQITARTMVLHSEGSLK